MPTWSSLQSLIQFGAGINAAIFSVTALREPLVRREKDAVDSLMKQHAAMLANPKVREHPSWRAFHSNCLKVRADFVDCDASFKGRDAGIQLSAGVAAVLSVIALVYSAYEPNGEVDHLGVAILSALALLPSVAALGFNVFVVARKLAGIRRLRGQTDSQLVELTKVFVENP